MACPFSMSSRSGDWIGVFDSGVGGLAVASEIIKLMPGERLFYFADTLRLPYGEKSLDEVRAFAMAAARGLLELPAKAVVVACNTASAAALAEMRRCFPEGIFVGMEPAIKPAVLKSQTRKIGVLATPATFTGIPFKRLEQVFGADAEIIPQPCPGLAEAVERHGPSSMEVRTLAAGFIGPLVACGIDCLVLGCTHYSLAGTVIGAIAGPGVEVVDPSPAVARRVRQVLSASGLLNSGGVGELSFRASGDVCLFSESASLILGRSVKAERADFFDAYRFPSHNVG